MSEYKTVRYLAAEETMKKDIPAFCAHCIEHLMEHGDCFDAGIVPDALQCTRVQREIEKRMETVFRPVIGEEQL